MSRQSEVAYADDTGMTGWVGWIPAFTFEALWAAPMLALAMSAPTLYVSWRVRAHQAGRLRCDWIAVR